jgi:hypothetical protein
MHGGSDSGGEPLNGLCHRRLIPRRLEDSERRYPTAATLAKTGRRQQGSLPFAGVIGGNDDSSQLHSFSPAQLIGYVKVSLMKQA